MQHNLIFPSVISSTRLEIAQDERNEMLEACMNWMNEDGTTMLGLMEKLRKII